LEFLVGLVFQQGARFRKELSMSNTPLKVALSICTALALSFSPASVLAAGDKDKMTDKAPAKMSAKTPAPEGQVPPPTMDTNKDGKPDAWDRDANGVADAWDVNGDGQPDQVDNNGDGRPDDAKAPPPSPEPAEPPR
jgi:hypothetical protein